MKLVPKLTLVVTSLSLSFNVVSQQAADAAIINYDFTVNSSLVNGSGSFSFDDLTFNNEAIPTAPVQQLNFAFNNDPQTVYTEKDDIDYPISLGPVVFANVVGNSSIGLSYLFNNKSDASISYEIAGYDFIVGNQTFSDAVSYTSVPEPTTWIGLFSVCSIAWLMSKKVKSAKNNQA
ncbi:PEP-CTERM sorting domain-containing protein [Halotia branconii]|uniref:PEP-CTERM sorting domain-containing protein n=1 Tax=Halotia branconii CENA392 TaxID=1539056 RepID=A0AAJ6NNU5_9CYAN|nr:PEP-CTERM sorting domain-containing protein [Halotia branconii]WGV23950.1 PEP-CTERM sorting domain-containing protein [Halotia branconii CENA392]